MDIRYEHNGLTFIWNAKKASANIQRHNGITFEQAATVFFDPLFRLVEVARNDEARDAVIGFDAQGHLLFVVHIERLMVSLFASYRLARPLKKR